MSRPRSPSRGPGNGQGTPWCEPSVPVAIVVRKPGSTLTSDGLMIFLQERLGKFKMPRIVEFADQPLPKTGTGKIRKLVLRERFWAGKEKRVQG